MVAITFLIFLVSCFLLFITAGLASGTPKKITIANVFSLYFIFVTIPAYSYDFIAFRCCNDNEKVVVYSLLAISAAMISFGILLGASCLNQTKLIKANLYISPMKIILVSVPFIWIGLYYMSKTAAYLTLSNALNGNSLESVRIRAESTNAILRHGALFSLPFIYIFPALSLVSYLEYLRRKKIRIKKNKVLLFSCFLIYLSMTLIYSISLTQKYYIVQTGLFFLVALGLYSGSKISYSRLILLFIVAVILISALWMFYAQTPINRAFEAPIWVLKRILNANLDGIIYYVRFAADNPLLLGKSFPNTLHLLPYEPISISKIISARYILTTDQLSAGIVGSHPTMFVGEIFVNFGFLGCAISSLLLGFVIGAINSYFARLIENNADKSTFFIAIYAMLIVWSLEVVTGSLFSFLHYLTLFNEMILVTIATLFITTRNSNTRK